MVPGQKKNGGIESVTKEELMVEIALLKVELEEARLYECQIKKMQQDLEFAHAELDTIFSNSMVGIVLLDSQRNLKRANRCFAQISGYDSPEDVEGVNVREFYLSQEHYEKFGRYYVTTLQQRGVVRGEAQFRKKDGSFIWASVVGKAIDPADPPDLDKGVIWIVDDITEKRETELKLKRAYAEMESIFNNSMVGIAMLRGGRKLYRANRRMAEILGYDSPKELIESGLMGIHLSQKNFKEFGEKFYNSLVNGELLQIEYQLKRKDSSPVWVSISEKAIDSKTPPDLDEGVILIVDDITRQKENEKRITEMANIDSLTGVNNRRHFLDLGRRELAVHNRSNRSISLLMLDLDHFKSINDSKGHAVGDAALKLFISICRETVRETDIIGRIGGEEFAVILPDTDLEKACNSAERIRSAVEVATGSNKEIPSFTVSIGVTTAATDDSLDTLINNADRNLYLAKTNGRNRVQSD